ncbi:MAG: HAD hydrolase-like protein [Lachnospiraceae bacterium]|nr:HAD hydrolase-like protein [Lachnospiraceae bacterium]
MIKYIFWDLDGTIMESGSGVLSSVRYALDKLGVELPESEVRKFIGPSLFDSFTNTAHMSEEDAEKAIQFYRELYESEGIFDAHVYEGIPETLEVLKKEGYRQFVVTSKPHHMAQRVLYHFGIKQYMDGLVGPTEDDHSSDKAKLIRTAMDSNGIEKSEAVMIGDRCFDINGANDVGIHSIGVLYGYGSKEELEKHGAGLIVEKAVDIPEAVKSL